ncbi:MAG: hypothetical protein ACOYXB_13180 [Bacteroidota bacterium]
MRRVIQVLLVVSIFVLGYLIIESIMKPIRFQNEVKVREKATVQRLINIREAQKAYKDVYKKYTGSFDTLIYFLRNDSFAVIKAIGEIPEDWLDELGLEEAKRKALKEGVISRETTMIPVMDSLFGQGFPLDSLRYIPFTEGAKFELSASQITTSSNLVVQVVEASCLYDSLLSDLDPQLVVNYNDEKLKIAGFPGLKFGSLTEGTLTGNWE